MLCTGEESDLVDVHVLSCLVPLTQQFTKSRNTKQKIHITILCCCTSTETTQMYFLMSEPTTVNKTACFYNQLTVAKKTG